MSSLRYASLILPRSALLIVLWWILAGGAPSSWWIGVPAIALALVASLVLFPRNEVAWRSLMVFGPRFLWRSLQGGFDVAWRAFHPAMPVEPELVEYPLQLPPGLPQVFMANTVSLLPGTLSATIESNILTVHVLNKRENIQAELRQVEADVARLFIRAAGGTQ